MDNARESASLWRQLFVNFNVDGASTLADVLFRDVLFGWFVIFRLKLQRDMASESQAIEMTPKAKDKDVVYFSLRLSRGRQAKRGGEGRKDLFNPSRGTPPHRLRIGLSLIARTEIRIV